MSADPDQVCKDILSSKCYYELLGLPKTATAEEIKKSYRKKSLKCHPDKNNSEHAQEAFKKLSQAYVTLSDEEKRGFYDKFGNEKEYLKAQSGQGQNPF
mmetsp:Transcript_24701/g.38445  ORF Transcript_24701/g.38445 Transcript_24701/m.38445 type:complete len:99 (+) Transcript_24701:32-328(+)